MAYILFLNTKWQWQRKLRTIMHHQPSRIHKKCNNFIFIYIMTFTLQILFLFITIKEKIILQMYGFYIKEVKKKKEIHIKQNKTGTLWIHGFTSDSKKYGRFLNINKW